MIFLLDPDVEKVLSNPDHPYGKCVYHCDNNVVDNQIINMMFDNNGSPTKYDGVLIKCIEFKNPRNAWRN